MAFSRYVVAPLIVTALTGCSMQQTPALPVANAPNSQSITQSSQPVTQSAPSSTPEASATPFGDGCSDGGDIIVTPCRINLTPSNKGPITVTVETSAAASAKFTEHDVCGTVGVAKISQISADQWTVAAGSSTGTCEVRFSYASNGDELGHAILTVQTKP